MIHVRRRTILFWTIGILLLGAGPLLAYGPLVPWSPIHPGYDELRFARGRVLYPSGTTLPEAYRHIDDWIADGETFHSMRATKPITVVLCRDWNSFHRFAPWITSVAVAGLTLATGDAIYITPKVDEKRFDHGEFLRHEISHAVLSQNAPLLSAYDAPKRYPWLHEGLSVWFGRQRAYMTQAEFFEQAPALGVAKALHGNYRDTDMRFGYIAWRDFLDYLDQTYGHDRFVAFVHGANAKPDDTLSVFQSTLHVSWDEAVRQFESSVLTRTFTPRP